MNRFKIIALGSSFFFCSALAAEPFQLDTVIGKRIQIAIDPPDAYGSCHDSIDATVDALVQEVVVEKTIPGMTIAVTKDGRLVCSKGYGYANWEEETPMLPETRSQIGSTSKVLTTLAMMKLIEDESDVHLTTRVYGSTGLLNHPDDTEAYIQGIRRYYPLAAVAIGNNNRVLAWYTDHTYTIGSRNDLDKYVGPRAFTLPVGKTMPDLIAIARGGPDNHVYSWYHDGSYSIGTPNDLDAYGTYGIGDDPKVKVAYKRNTIVGIAMNPAGDKYFAYYHNGRVSSGTSPDNLKNRWIKDYDVPNDWQRRYDIVGIARGTDDKMVAWYSDNKASKGNTTNLSAHQSLFHFSSRIILDPAYWLKQIESIEIQHLLSHTSGISGSGDPSEGAIKYQFPAYDKDFNPLPYAYGNRYVLSTRSLLFGVGTDSSYSNHGLGLVGHLIETITGDDWYDYMLSNILEPIDASGIVPQGLYVDETLDAYPHRVSDDGTITTKPLESRNHSASAAGSLKASAVDLTRVMVATDGLCHYPNILAPDTLSQMESRPFADVAPGRAHGWQVTCQNPSDCSDQRRLWHNGVSRGGTSYIAKFQNFSVDTTVVDGINIALVANRPNAGTARFKTLAQDIALEVADSVIPTNYNLYAPVPDACALIETSVSPHDTDANIDANGHHLIYYNPAIPQHDELLVHLPGTFGTPANNAQFLRTVADQGMKAIGLQYVNNGAVNSLCNNEWITNPPADPDCQENVRLERIYGIDTSPIESVNVSPANSIVNRLVKLLEYLDAQQPGVGWGGYLNNGEPQWDRIVVSGHSQGSGMAALIARDEIVARVLLFAGPSDVDPLGNSADWIIDPKATPIGAHFGFRHVDDQPIIFQIWSDMGLLGPAVNVDSNDPPFADSHVLETDANVLQPHGSVIHNTIFSNVWAHLCCSLP